MVDFTSAIPFCGAMITTSPTRLVDHPVYLSLQKELDKRFDELETLQTKLEQSQWILDIAPIEPDFSKRVMYLQRVKEMKT